MPVRGSMNRASREQLRRVVTAPEALSAASIEPGSAFTARSAVSFDEATEEAVVVPEVVVVVVVDEEEDDEEEDDACASANACAFNIIASFVSGSSDDSRSAPVAIWQNAGLQRCITLKAVPADFTAESQARPLAGPPAPALPSTGNTAITVLFEPANITPKI